MIIQTIEIKISVLFVGDTCDTRVCESMAKQQPMMKILFQDALDLCNQRFDEAFELIWEATSLKEAIIAGETEIDICIPKKAQKTSWDEDLVDFITRCYERFCERVQFLTQNKLSLSSSYCLCDLDACSKKNILFRERVYKSANYQILLLYFEVNDTY